MQRREFLTRTARAAAGLSLLPLPACRCCNPESSHSRDRVGWEALVAHLDQNIPVWMQESSVPGLSLALIQDAKLAWRRGFGVKDRATNEPVETETVFEAASMSKPVFAYLVLKLCEKGLIDLDTPLTRYTSERFLEGDPRLDLITARHILSHTSGLPNWRSSKEPLKTQFTPGEKWLYSGEGYYYLQSVVTRLTHCRVDPTDCARFEADLEVCATDFDTFVQANLLLPFGMDSSGYVQTEPVARRMARPHDSAGQPKPAARRSGKTSRAAVARYGSAGALLTTPTDYAKFLIEVIDPKPRDSFRLGRESIQEMLRPHVKLQNEHPSSWALGWQLFHNPMRDFIYHGGDNAGFHCGALASVDGGCGYVAMTNGDNGPDVLRKLVTDEQVQRFLTAG